MKPTHWAISRGMTRRPNLWRGLLFCLPLWERMGSSVRDVAGGSLYPITGAGWIPAGLDFGAVSNVYYVDLNSNFGFGSTTQDFSIFTYGTWTYNADANDQQIIGRAGGNKLIQLGISNASFPPPKVRCYVGDATANFRSMVGTNISGSAGDIIPYNILWSHDADGTSRLYESGAEVATSSAAYTTAVQSAEIHIGRRGGDNAEPWAGTLSLIAVWDRALTATEARILAADPYGMVRPFRVIPIPLPRPEPRLVVRGT